MSGMLVLSNVLKGGDKPEKTPTPTGKDTSNSPENVAVFAALFDCCLNSNVDLKGQRAFLVNQASEEKQSNSYPLQIDQNLNVAGSMLEYGNSFFPFLVQMMPHSDFMEDKEANSGESISRGIEKLSLTNKLFLPNELGVAGKELELVMLKPVSQASNEDSASTWTTLLKSQGDNLGNMELGKYKWIISELLAALPGKITDITSEESHFRSTITQGWMTMTDDDIKNDHSISAQKAFHWLFEGLVKGVSSAGNLEPDRPAALSLILKEGTGSTNIPQIVKGTLITLINQLRGTKTDLETMAAGPSEAVFEPLKAIEFSDIKEGQSQSISTGAGVAVNVVQLSFKDGKIVWLPVYEQISALLREQVMNKQQTLKELDIQLHPEELGKIRIFLRWESGQVHLQVNATEAATGQLLQNQLPELRQNLLNQGVNCGSLQMGQNGEHRQQPQSDQANRSLHKSYSLSNVDEGVCPILNPLSFGQGGMNRINVMA